MEILGWILVIVVGIIWIGVKLLDGMTRHADFYTYQNTRKMAQDIEALKNSVQNSAQNSTHDE